ESFYEGTLLHIGIKEGETAKVDSLLAIIGKKDEDISDLIDGKSSDKKSEKDDSKKEEKSSDKKEDNKKSSDEENDSDEKDSDVDSFKNSERSSSGAEMPEGVEV